MLFYLGSQSVKLCGLGCEHRGIGRALRLDLFQGRSLLLPQLFDLLLVLFDQFLLFLSMAGGQFLLFLTMADLNLFNFTPVMKLYFALNGFLSLVFAASCIK